MHVCILWRINILNIQLQTRFQAIVVSTTLIRPCSRLGLTSKGAAGSLWTSKGARLGGLFYELFAQLGELTHHQDDYMFAN